MQQKTTRTDVKNNSCAIAIFFTGTVIATGAATYHLFGETNKAHSTKVLAGGMAGFLMAATALHTLTCGNEVTRSNRPNDEEQALLSESDVRESIEQARSEHAAALANKDRELEQATSALAAKDAQLKEVQSEYAAALTNKHTELEQTNVAHALEAGGLAMQINDLTDSNNHYKEMLLKSNKAHKEALEAKEKQLEEAKGIVLDIPTNREVSTQRRNTAAQRAASQPNVFGGFFGGGGVLSGGIEDMPRLQRTLDEQQALADHVDRLQQELRSGSGR